MRVCTAGMRRGRDFDLRPGPFVVIAPRKYKERLMTKYALVCGAGGFIGGHLVRRLKKDGFWIRGVDLKFHEFSETQADDFVVGDLRDQGFCRAIVDRRFDEVYQLAADGSRRLHFYG